MEKESKPVAFSTQFKQDIIDVYKYGSETFGILQAEKYQHSIYKIIESLEYSYNIYPECRHLPTKSKMYRWVILESHLIIYRVTSTKILVLRIIHACRSITKIKASRKIVK
jgi:plasmid stabilization system protein ParE